MQADGSRPPAGQVLALDFGGTKLAAAVVDAATGSVLEQLRRPTPQQRSAESSLNVMMDMGKQLVAHATKESRRLSAVGVSFGGPVVSDNGSEVRSNHVTGWESVNLPALFEATFELPIVVENDANAAAACEWRFGAGRGCQHVMYLQISTGIGMGLVLGGRLYRGAGSAGEFGHAIIKEQGPACVCGERGCVESFASGWAIERDARAALQGGEAGDAMLALCGGRPEELDARLVVQAADAGDSVAAGILRHAFGALGRALRNAVALLDPEVVVVGGGIAQAKGRLVGALEEELDRRAAGTPLGRPPITLAQFLSDAPLIGAATLAAESLSQADVTGRPVPARRIN